MLSRRDFLGTAALAAVGSGIRADAPKAGPRKKLAVVTTEWRYHSHAWHMAERFLAGYPVKGRWHRPPIDVVSAYVDQFPKRDLSRQRAKESGFTIYPTVAEALRCGGDRLAVDAVLVIGEHGDYPDNEIGQKKYPRYEFFQKVVEVFRKDGRTAPVFNDKHLSWNWEWAREMVDTAREMKFPLMAGSSLPVTRRMPALDLPHDAEVGEVMCVAMGQVDSYDFHALEVIQCMAERRKGGETGVKALQALRGPEVWKLLAGRRADLFGACLSRSHNLAQAPTYS
ncbi:MAG TPA: twin-arginine translocation signal domain-containing protein, partial [Fimbriiglobus sp.]|nr:twin-arginine translocation signal domain-containing protein [Fimbriiglobus sp.]